MSKIISNEDKAVKENLSKWDKHIADIERRLTRLKTALTYAKEMKEAGEPCPVTAATQN